LREIFGLSFWTLSCSLGNSNEFSSSEILQFSKRKVSDFFVLKVLKFTPGNEFEELEEIE